MCVRQLRMFKSKTMKTEETYNEDGNEGCNDGRTVVCVGSVFRRAGRGYGDLDGDNPTSDGFTFRAATRRGVVTINTDNNGPQPGIALQNTDQPAIR